jgi:hypothetical protein
MQGLLIFTIACLILSSPRAFAFRDALTYSRNDASSNTHGMDQSTSVMKSALTARDDDRDPEKFTSVKRRKLLQTYAYTSSVYTISFVGCYYDCSTRIFSIYSDGITPLQCANHARASGYSHFGMEYPGKLHLLSSMHSSTARKRSSELVYVVCMSEGEFQA